MSALMSQHEAWVAARARMGAPVRRQFRIVETKSEVPEPKRVYHVSTDPADWCERPTAPYDQYVPPLPLDYDFSPAHRILGEVAIKYGYTIRILRSADRSWPVCRARNEAIYRMRNELGLSRGTIGRLLGHRDITTIKSSEKSHAKRLLLEDIPTIHGAAILGSDRSAFDGAGSTKKVFGGRSDLHELST